METRLSGNVFCAFWRQYDVKTGSQNRTLKCGYYSNRLTSKWMFWRRDYFMYVFYSFRECHYLKRAKMEIKLKIRIVHWVCCSIPWWSFSGLPSSNLPNRWSTKQWTSAACGGGGCRRTHRTPTPYGPAVYRACADLTHFNKRGSSECNLPEFCWRISPSYKLRPWNQKFVSTEISPLDFSVPLRVLFIEGALKGLSCQSFSKSNEIDSSLTSSTIITFAKTFINFVFHSFHAKSNDRYYHL